MRVLDFVMTGQGNIGLITELSKSGGVEEASILFLKHFEEKEKTAWWCADELTVLDNFSDLLSKGLRHPFSEEEDEEDEDE